MTGSAQLFERLLELQTGRGRGVLCTVVRTSGSAPRRAGAKMLVYPDGRIVGTIGGGEMESRVIGDALEVLAGRETRVTSYLLRDPGAGDPGVCGGEVEIFMEPIAAQATLLVIGGGHVGRALVHLGGWLGFRVVVSDDRSEHCTPESVPGADEYLCAPIAELPTRLNFDTDTYIVMPTRGVPVDIEGLPHLLDVPHGYLGVIGSRRRWAIAVKRLVDVGVPREKLERIHAPMGLELNAETPEEIALSVLAEVVMLRNRANGESMRFMQSIAEE